MIKAVTVADIFNEVKFEGDESGSRHITSCGHKFTVEGLKHSWGTLKGSLGTGVMPGCQTLTQPLI